jgi:hypothetical protein
MMDVATLADKKKPAASGKTATSGSGATTTGAGAASRAPGMALRPDVNTIGMGGGEGGNATTWRTKLWDK